MSRSEARTLGALGPFRRDLLRAELPYLQRPSARVAARWVAWLSSPWVTVREPERLATFPEPTIYALNHNNTLESLQVAAFLLVHRQGRTVRFFVDWMFAYVPVAGWFVRRIDPILVYTKPWRYRLFEGVRHRRRRVFSPVEAGAESLAAGKSLGIYPEGTRNSDPTTLLRGRSGLGQIALLSTAPVVPVGLYYRDKDRLGRVPSFGRFELRMGEPLDLAAERAEFVTRLPPGITPNVAAVQEYGRDLARGIVDQVMVQIAALCDKVYPYSVSDREDT